MEPNRNLPNINNLSVYEKLQKWENLEEPLAPLTSFQRNSCHDLADELAERPIRSSLSLTPSSKDESSKEEASGELRLETCHQFFNWFSQLDDELLRNENSECGQYLEELKISYERCSDILTQVECVLQEANTLKEYYDSVHEKTNTVRSLSEALHSKKNELTKMYKNLDEKTDPFKRIENIITQVQSANIFTLKNNFTELLNNLDYCLHYFKSNETYKQSSLYVIHTRQCLCHLLQLAKSYIISVFDTCKNFQPSTTVKSINTDNKESENPVRISTSRFTELYGMFQINSSKVKMFINEIENRVENSPEYENVLTDIHKYYTTIREELIDTSVTDCITKLVTSRTGGDYCSLLRTISTFLIYFSQDEYKLYFEFFSFPSVVFTKYLEGICSCLYDTMRPLIIQMKHMETLAELCSILRIEILQDQVNKANSQYLEAFGNVIEQLLQDVQERLVFRAHLYFKTDILEYKPAPGDLAYPEKLEMMKDLVDEIQAQETISLSRCDSRLSLASVSSTGDSIRSNVSSRRWNQGTSAADLHGMWYPTVKRALLALSRLYRCVEKAIFQGLAQEAIQCCAESVAIAAQMIASNKELLDGQLFEIKHLLILREQIAPFHVDFTVKQTTIDFSNLKTEAYKLFQKHDRLFALNSNNGFLEFITKGTPVVRESYLDSRKILDNQLKNTCQRFIEDSSNLVISPIKEFLHRVKLFENKKSVREQSFAKTEYVASLVEDSLRNVKIFICSLNKKMNLYLSNADTQFILYRPIKNNIVDAFSRLHDTINEVYTQDEQLKIACPTAQQITVIISSSNLSTSKSAN